jgi:hypothetical protein
MPLLEMHLSRGCEGMERPPGGVRDRLFNNSHQPAQSLRLYGLKQWAERPEEPVPFSPANRDDYSAS